jgi:hypothetical protein
VARAVARAVAAAVAAACSAAAGGIQQSLGRSARVAAWRAAPAGGGALLVWGGAASAVAWAALLLLLLALAPSAWLRAAPVAVRTLVLLVVVVVAERTTVLLMVGARAPSPTLVNWSIRSSQAFAQSVVWLVHLEPAHAALERAWQQMVRRLQRFCHRHLFAPEALPPAPPLSPHAALRPTPRPSRPAARVS